MLLCFALCLVPAAASAESGSTAAGGGDVITGFVFPDSAATVDTAYKYAMIELRKEFPAELTVLLNGELSRQIDVTWRCLEDYEEDLELFHFVPELDGYTLAEGLDLPVITVHVLGQIITPPLIEIPEDVHPLLPSVGAVSNSSIPSYYNGYTLGNLPTVRNQNPYGTCWAFATVAAVEADLIHDGKVNTNVDLSELHLAYFTYHNFNDEKGCNIGDIVYTNGADYLMIGGSPLFASLTLANMIGPNPESSVPYSDASSYAPSPDDGRTGSVQLTGAYSYALNDRNAVKDAIMNHGAVTVGYFSDWDYYSYDYNSFYYPTRSGTNHVVALVGWDDSFSANHFLKGTPPGNGAWLVRNSWGVNGYNYAGYFWMSYYDQSLAPTVIAVDAETWRYDHCYAYDNIPSPWWVNYQGNPLILSQDFTVDGDEQIQAVGLYTEMSNVGVCVSLTNGSKTVSTNAGIAAPGYYLISLPEPLPISSRSKVTVSYNYTGTSGNPYFSFEGDDNYRSIQFASSVGSGFKVDGNYYEYDGRRYDARLKLFTVNANVPFEADLILPANLTKIESEAFADGSFSSVYIPRSTKSIASDAFGTRTELTVYGDRGSYAETYAQAHGFTFIPVK